MQELLLHDSMDLTKKTRYGETPLHIACRKGKAKVVEKIVSWADKGEKLKLLLSQVDNDGGCPLMPRVSAGSSRRVGGSLRARRCTRAW